LTIANKPAPPSPPASSSPSEAEYWYHGVSKRDSDAYLNLPVTFSDDSFWGTNGDYTYRVNEDALTVYKNHEQILYEATY
jgi:hypothetical protein